MKDRTDRGVRSAGMIIQFFLALAFHGPLATEAAVLTSRRNSSKSMSSLSSSTTFNSAATSVSGFKLDLDQLQKRGLSPDDVLRHIRLLAEGRIAVDGTCLDNHSRAAGRGGVTPRRLHTHSRMSGRVNQSTVVDDRGELERKFIRNRTITCNDRSKAGYYIRRSPSGSRRWLIFLEGGSMCFDRKSCEGRWLNTPHLMSSDDWSLTRRGAGILSIDPTENPFIHDGNIVLVPYCTSDSWSGTYKPSKKGDFSFMGSIIVQEVFKELVEWHGLSSASTIFLTGSSAGGTGVLVNLDRVATQMSRLSPGAVVRGIVDSGWFLDNKPLRPVECTDAHQCSPIESVRRGFQLWHGLVPDACQRLYPKSEHWKCYFGYRLYRSLHTVVFIIQYLFDEAQVTADNVGPPVQPDQWRYIHNLGIDVKHTLSNVSAVFAPACLSHMLITRREWCRVTIDGCSLPDTLKCWESGGMTEKNHYYDQMQFDHHYQRADKAGNQYNYDPIPRLLTGYNSRRQGERLQADQPPRGTGKSRKNRRKQRRKLQRRNRKNKQARLLAANNQTTATPPGGLNHDVIVGTTGTSPPMTSGTNIASHQHRQRVVTNASSRRRGNKGGDSRQHRRRRTSAADASVVGIHEIHHAQQHSNAATNGNRCCGHRRLDSCSWPQCNAQCPPVLNPFTGEEIDLVELLTVQFGVDVKALARSAGLDPATVRNINHSELMRLLVRSGGP